MLRIAIGSVLYAVASCRQPSALCASGTNERNRDVPYDAPSASLARWILLPFAAAILAACGGGGGGGGSGAGSPPPVSTTWVQGQFSPESDFAEMCVTPRTGIDPGTQKPYPDVQGTLLDELNWLRSWNNDLYLWFDEVPDQNPGQFLDRRGLLQRPHDHRDHGVGQTERPIPFHLRHLGLGTTVGIRRASRLRRQFRHRCGDPAARSGRRIHRAGIAGRHAAGESRARRASIDNRRRRSGQCQRSGQRQHHSMRA